MKFSFFLIFLIYFQPSLALAARIDLALTPEILKEVKGPQGKRNSLRSDIVKYIDSESNGSTLKKSALTQLATDYQTALEHIENVPTAVAASENAVHSEFCVRYAFPENGYLEASKLHGKMLNTYLRARIGIRIHTFMAKAYPYTPNPNDWAKDCRFLHATQSKAKAQTQRLLSGTRIFFGNGMFNSASDANASLYELEKLDLGSIESDPSDIHYDLALNVSESRMDNILTVISQRINGDISYFWNIMDAIIPMPEWLVDPITNTLEGFQDASNLDGDTLTTMMKNYQASLDRGEKIILVSHSQGNFYAEEAIKRLLRQNHQTDPAILGFGNVRVATPTFSFFSFPHFTFTDDRVILLVSAFLGAPDANLISRGAGPGPYLDPWAHNFVLSYLHNAESRSKINAAIIQQAEITSHP